MKETLLLDVHLSDRGPYLLAGLRELGWDELLTLHIVLLRDIGLPDDCPDDRLWRFTQLHRIWLLTSNRNSDGETSLQATIIRENTPESLPVLTLSHANLLATATYRQRVVDRLVEILIVPEMNYGAGRMFLP